MSAQDPSAPTHVLYLHGFRSSPRSFKASLMAGLMARHHPQVHWWCPQLPASPADAARLLAEGVRDWPAGRRAVVGSSLGGFYATWVGERLWGPPDRVVVLNPAVDPARDLARHIGTQLSWHDPGLSFEFTASHVAQLRDLEVGTLHEPQRYFSVIAKGDELLDWREMSARYAGCPGLLLGGSDHALSDFEAHVGQVFAALGLPVGD